MYSFADRVPHPRPVTNSRNIILASLITIPRRVWNLGTKKKYDEKIEGELKNSVD